MSEDSIYERSGQKVPVLELFAPLPRHYDRVAAVTSFGQCPRFRRAMVTAVGPRSGDRVLDVATGTGLVAEDLVRRYGCTVVGLDQSNEMLDGARSRLADDPVLAARISLVTGEAEELPFANGEFDHLTFTYLLRYVADPAAVLRELARVVRPGGHIASVEFGVPSAPLHVVWKFYMGYALPAAIRLVSREWTQAIRFLSYNVPAFYERYPLERLVELWREAGIGSVQARRMSLGSGVVMSGTRGGDVA